MEAREAIRQAPTNLRAKLGEDDSDEEEEEEDELSDLEDSDDLEKKILGDKNKKMKPRKKMTFMTKNQNRNNADFDNRTTKQKREDRFKDFKKAKLLETDLVREMEDELEERPKEIVRDAK